MTEYFVYAWGYEQTNVEFYKIVRRTAKTVTIQQVEVETEAGDLHHLTYRATPTETAKEGREPFRRTISRRGDREYVRMPYGFAEKWNGQPVEGSSYY